MNAREVKDALRQRYMGAGKQSERYVLIEEARSGAGFDGNAGQCDLLAINTWPGRGMELIGHEVKVNMSDWKAELEKPEKAERFARYCNRWYVAVPSDLAKKIDHEVPPAWGLLAVSDSGRTREVVKPERRTPEDVPAWWWIGWLAWAGTNGSAPAGADMPKPKSVCWIPELFGASLAYGRNLLTGEPCRQWITRPQITWCKPSPTPGEIIDKFREATELIVWAAKQPRYYFDLDAVREPPKEDWGDRVVNSGAFRGHPREKEGQGRPDRACNPKGVPPLNWWKIKSSGYDGAHFATFPPELIRRPVIASCPPGGTILDPFGGSGTTAAVATGHGRNCISIDFNPENADLARERCGMFLDVDYGTTVEESPAR